MGAQERDRLHQVEADERTAREAGRAEEVAQKLARDVAKAEADYAAYQAQVAARLEEEQEMFRDKVAMSQRRHDEEAVKATKREAAAEARRDLAFGENARTRERVNFAIGFLEHHGLHETIRVLQEEIGTEEATPEEIRGFVDCILSEHGSLHDAFAELDQNQSGQLSLTEFEAKVVDQWRYCDSKVAKRIFRAMDNDSTRVGECRSMISWTEFSAVLSLDPEEEGTGTATETAVAAEEEASPPQPDATTTFADVVADAQEATDQAAADEGPDASTAAAVAPVEEGQEQGGDVVAATPEEGP